MFIEREIENEVLDGANSFPVVTVTGPRQSGKTTMLKHLFPKKNTSLWKTQTIMKLRKLIQSNF